MPWGFVGLPMQRGGTFAWAFTTYDFLAVVEIMGSSERRILVSVLCEPSLASEFIVTSSSQPQILAWLLWRPTLASEFNTAGSSERGILAWLLRELWLASWIGYWWLFHVDVSSYEPEPQKFGESGDLPLPFLICQKGTPDHTLKIHLLSEIKVIHHITIHR